MTSRKLFDDPFNSDQLRAAKQFRRKLFSGGVRQFQQKQQRPKRQQDLHAPSRQSAHSIASSDTRTATNKHQPNI
jgi:hypothetical protein